MLSKSVVVIVGDLRMSEVLTTGHRAEGTPFDEFLEQFNLLDPVINC